mmetsp:Transcript_19393/g.74470  ORF Transcript_19393/g.74470 Transcript_19393/m.74470 type:complete len:211 (+) Transcript_19393:172-804(+)|eukprot:CAMPEP_0114609016 /NCGR_PEP_ID=MMETSP0168-20121206/2873_1 /TAXON_ID=95228 ORGANISM="Vannella sp., Strain DIVA3 517/6/12" /NCGR_SAMPLE_ID=MMETSP0168 /ASSEMBLY_ACC=CAM_ASM_000044 /LENGTH=210 /DNA_ID=CAMNT_0001819925 /DNA_START=156 /DNA_END=788 /DNA_ORIENTATION=-
MSRSVVWTAIILAAAVIASAHRGDAQQCEAASCSTCLANDGCGYCELGEASFCSLGDSTGPAKGGACSSQGGVWRFSECGQCSPYADCFECVNNGCGFCADDGSCGSDRGACREWLSQSIDCQAKAQSSLADAPCEFFGTCAECVNSVQQCKYCVAGVGCVPLDAAVECERAFVTAETENECPSTNVDDSTVLKPFVCVIVLVSFLIAFM